MLRNLYLDEPENVEEAIRQAVKFLNCGKENEDTQQSNESRLYSFSKDASFIFAAFRQTHGIDLETIHLHWWKFIALFMDLGSETTWSHIVGLRKRLKDGSAFDEERKVADEMRDIIDIPQPDTRTIEEREQELEFMRLIGQNKNG